MNEARPVLLVRLPNWVGDVCMALPTLCQLEAVGFAPVLAGRRWAAELLAGQGWPVLALPAGIRAASSVLRSAGARHGLLLTNSIGSAAAMRLAGVAALGHRNEGRSLLLGRAIAKPTGTHEVETFWRLGALTAAWRGRPGWPEVPPPSLGLQLTESQRTAARDALRAAGITDGDAYVVLAPLATGTVAGVSKCWPGFAALGRMLRDRGIATVCCPGPGEEAAASAAVPDARLLPRLGLGAYAAVCAGARLTVSNDSGPMHLAAAVDAEVIGVFGPSDPRRVSPWGPRTAWLGGGGDWPAQGVVERSVDTCLARNAMAKVRPRV